MPNMLYPSILSLKDGTFYKGWSFFDLKINKGEIVFNTGMTGYQEILSDPSYTGQMVVLTYPEIGNTGLNKDDNESNFVSVTALIFKNISTVSSSWRSAISLKDYLIIKKIPHIFGLDTRSLTIKLRTCGVMPCILYSPKILKNKLDFNGESFNDLDLIKKISVPKYYNYFSSYSSLFNFKDLLYKNNLNELSFKNNYKVVVIDFGLKFSILRYLLTLGCNISVVPATFSYDSIVKLKPNGILLSNGPGNPQLANYAINTVKKLLNYANIPVFGICMGHQLLNLACGLSTSKLKFGHRGLNHPSGDQSYSEITSQNHGFAVNSYFVPISNLREMLLTKYNNLNDGTVASTFHQNALVFSVQYHPEASPGPHDTNYLFKVFIDLIRLSNNN
uniref:Carbamoyl phosphate synthase small chain n=1 Tax=Kapraunia schneideri TaxID=717899 RepID=A0A1Z1MRV2_9FLOR|nr:carbamoyl phosphate synthase small subunit [Kapraunia schneideri]ARW68830.1 carbamoyl phosphate synthase small subunit [Kapraunia schneideri]